MSAPAHWRSPFGVMKRIRMSRSKLPFSQSQRAGMADGPVSDLPFAEDESPADLGDLETLPAERIEQAVLSREHNIGQGSEQRLAPVAEKEKIKKPPPLPGMRHTPLSPRTQSLLHTRNLPPNLLALHMAPLRRTPQHEIPVCDLQLRSYSVRNLDLFADFAMRAAYYLNLPVKGPVPLPQIVERFTVPRGPFVHKKSQENFERKTLRRLLQVQDGNPESLAVWLAYLRKRAYYGVGMKANVFEWEGLDVVARMDEHAQAVARQHEDSWELFGTLDGEHGGDKSKELVAMMEEGQLPDVAGLEAPRREPVEVRRGKP